jgi:hypothetical protein
LTEAVIKIRKGGGLVALAMHVIRNRGMAVVWKMWNVW